MRWGVALLCVAACGGGTGVDLEIYSEVPIESVEIFIANTDCTERDGETPCSRDEVGWLAGQVPVPGTIYEMHNEDFDKQKLELRLTPEAMADGTTYTVRLVAEGDIGESHMIAIVGLDGAGDARALAVLHNKIPENTAEHWVVTLKATDAATASLDKPTGSDTERRVAVWGRDGSAEQQAGARCLVMQKWTGSEWKSEFIVPASDHDCDGYVPELECDDQYYHLNAERPAACVDVQPVSAGGTTGPCTLGITSCRDGVSNDPGCQLPQRGSFAAPHICVPDMVCELCDESDRFGVVPCIRDAMRKRLDVAHATCRLYGSVSTGAACGPQKAGSAASLHLAVQSCAEVDLRAVAAPLAPTKMSTLTVGQATFGAVLGDDPGGCTINIQLLSGTVVNGTDEWLVVGVYPRLQDLSAMLIPIKIEFPSGGTDCNGGLVIEDCGTSQILNDNIRYCGGQ